MCGIYACKGFSDSEAAALTGLGNPLASVPPSTGPEIIEDLPDALMHMDFAYWLPENILLQVDRASMYNSLECRDPMRIWLLLTLQLRAEAWLPASGRA